MTTLMLEALRSPFIALTQLLPLWLLLGACVGSFLSMVAHRLPQILDAQERGEEPAISLSSPGSSCAHCGAPIRWYHNVPFIGFLLVQRATPCCGRRLPWRYLGFEAAATLWALVVWLLYPEQPLEIWAWGLFGWILLVAAVIDAKTQWLPDVLTMGLLWAGLCYGAMGGSDLSLEYRVTAAVVVYVLGSLVSGLFTTIRGKVGLGGGDIKLLAALAVWLPALLVAYVVLIGSVLQLLWMLSRRTDKAAFGPALCAAAGLAYAAAHLRLLP